MRSQNQDTIRRISGYAVASTSSSGPNWHVQKGATGIWVLYITDPLCKGALGGITVTYQGSGTVFVQSVSGPKSNALTLQIKDSAGNPSDQAFHFNATYRV